MYYTEISKTSTYREELKLKYKLKQKEKKSLEAKQIVWHNFLEELRNRVSQKPHPGGWAVGLQGYTVPRTQASAPWAELNQTRFLS